VPSVSLIDVWNKEAAKPEVDKAEILLSFNYLKIFNILGRIHTTANKDTRIPQTETLVKRKEE
jgi:hypothetical protein